MYTWDLSSWASSQKKNKDGAFAVGDALMIMAGIDCLSEFFH